MKKLLSVALRWTGQPARVLLPVHPLKRAVLGLALAGLTVIAHDVGILLVARVLSVLASMDWVRQLAVGVFRDEVYARLVLGMVANVDVRGLAVSGPLHALLSPLAQSLLQPDTYLSRFGDWTGVVFAADSSAVGVHIVQMVVNLSMVASGAAVLSVWRGRQRGRAIEPMLLLGLLWLGYGAGAELQLPWGKGTGGEMALSMVATKIAGLSSGAYDNAVQHGRLLSAALNGTSLVLAIAAGMVVSLPLAYAIRRGSRAAPAAIRVRRGRVATSAALLLMVLIYGTVSSAVAFESSHASVAAPPTNHSQLATAVSNWPSVVTISKRTSGVGWDYKVNGRAELVRGMGYNAITAGLDPMVRAAIFDRDFSAIHDMGANTIEGWSEDEFDDVLVQKAAEHGLGVILPFVLGPMTVTSGPYYDYTDAATRQRLMQAISQRVMHFRNSPALRMWGLGNEVLHALKWAQASPDQSRAFADFLIQAADQVHALDPNHPVVYRDAEDWYAQPVLDALARNPKPRPWFVYGMNFFASRIDSALDRGQVSRLEQPMMISEFGPVGLRPDARPAGYADFWKTIERRGDHLIGGSAYVWTTAGPEPLDRNFGLTNADGQPVDGSLSELSSLFQASADSGH